MPAAFKEPRPAGEDGVDGRPTGIVDDDELGFAGGGGVIARDGSKKAASLYRL